MANEWKELQSTNNVGFKEKWDGSSINYTFLNILPDYYLNGSGYASWYDDEVETAQGFLKFSSKQKQVISFILENSNSSEITGDYANNTDYRVSFSDVINFSFSEEIQNGNSVGNITFVNATLENTLEEGRAFFPDAGGFFGQEGGDVIIDQDNSLNADNNIDLGESGFWTQLHELGHAFGGLIDVNLTSLAGSSQFNSMKYTMMSYATFGGVYASGLQLFDIAALQDTYGTTNMTTRNTDTVYALGQGLGFDGAAATDGFLYTIWDGGGDDTIDASGFSSLGFGAEIDLREGRFSSIGVQSDGVTSWDLDAAPAPFDPDPGNVAIAYGTEIENAIGTAHDDHIIGNELDNTIIGGAGDDTIEGRGGNDTVDYSGDAGAIIVTVNADGTTSVVDASGSTDTLSSIEKILANSAYQNTLIVNDQRSIVDGDAILIAASGTANPDGLSQVSDIQNVIINNGAEGYFNIEELGNTFSVGSNGSTFSYQGHQGPLTFDFENLTVSDATNTDILDQNAEDSTFIGTNNGDTYVFETPFQVSLDIVEYPDMIFSGSGDDVFRHSENILDVGYFLEQGLIFYGGGNDVVESILTPQSVNGFNDAYSLPFNRVVLPFDVKISDISVDLDYRYSFPHINNLDLLYEVFDITYQINGYGSIKFEHGYTKTTNFATNPNGMFDLARTALVISKEGTEFTDGRGFSHVVYDDNTNQTEFQPQLSEHNTSVIINGGHRFTALDQGKDLFSLNASNAYFGTFGDDDYDLTNYTAYDTFYAYDGDDTIIGNTGDSIIYGGGGQDTLSGNTGNDQLFGGVGDDILNGDENDDILTGGSGNDIIDGGTGIDTAAFEFNIQNYQITLDNGVYTVVGVVGNDGTDTLINIEKIQFLNGLYDGGLIFADNGTVYDDRINGSSSADIITGLSGDDWIASLEGDDTIFGDQGNDRIDGGLGNDTISGGDGDDFIYMGAGNDLVTGGLGRDTFIVQEVSGLSVIEDFDITQDIFDLTNIEGVYELDDISFGLGVNDVILRDGALNFGIEIEGVNFFDLNASHFIFRTPDGDIGTNTLPGMPSASQNGTSSDDSLSSFNSAGEVLNGLGGNDFLEGWDGNDYLYGDAGDDDLSGGDGDDVLFSGTGDFHFMGGGTGNDFYILDSDSGFTEIFEEGGFDTIVIPNDVNIADLQLSVSGDLLSISSNNSNHNLYVDIYDQFLTGADAAVEFIVVQDIVYDLSVTANSSVWTVYVPITSYIANNTPNAFDDMIVLDDHSGISGSVFDDNGNGADYDPNDIFIEVDAISNQGAFGDFQLLANGNFTFTPDAGFSGDQLFTYTLKDSDGNSSQADITFTVPQPNGSPVANDDSVSTAFEQAIAIDVLANDTDPESQPLSIVSVFASSAATLTINPNNTITYTPELGFSGSDSFTYTIQDNQGAQSTATATVLVQPDSSAINGTTGDDTLNGTALDDNIYGLDGSDTVYADAGNDLVVGGNGDDTLYGQTGNDTLYGQSGNDILKGWHGDDTLYGGIGNDFLYGENDNDVLYGEDGDDTIEGGSGNDELYGGAGNDDLNGGAGHDTIEGGDGNDIINGVSGNDALHGGDGNDTIYAGTGSDVLLGGDGDDTIYGNSGNDYIHGQEGADTLYGQTGRDFLYGEAGADILYGGGADNKDDRFVFDDVFAFQGVDTIKDFAVGEDKIDISDVLNGFYTAGVDDIADFVSMTDDGTHTTIAIDQDGTGTGSTAQDIVVVENVIWASIAAFSVDAIL